MSGILCYRYEGRPISEKFGWVNATPGMEAVLPAADGVRNMAQTLGTIANEAGKTMRDLGMSWTGPASDGAGRSTRQIVRSAANTRSLTDNGADRIMDYGRSFEWLRPQIAYDDPAKYGKLELAGDLISEGWHTVWGNGEDHVTVGERNQGHDALANRALGQHEINARHADDGFTTAGADPQPGAGVSPGGGGTDTGPAVGGPSHVSTASAVPSGTGVAPIGTAPVGSSPVGAAPGTPGAGVVVPAPAGAAPGPNGTGRTGSSGTGTGQAGTGKAGSPGTGTGTAGTGLGAPSGTAAAGLPGTAGRGASPDAGRAASGQRFGDDLRSRGLGTPSSPGGAGTPSPYGGLFGRGATGVGGRPAYGAPRSGTSFGYGGENGNRTGVPRGGPGLPGEGVGGGGGVVEPAVSGRPGTAGAGLGAGYAPLMGAGGGMRSDGQSHRNRYLLPSSEPFEVELPYAPPVLGPAEDDGEVPA